MSITDQLSSCFAPVSVQGGDPATLTRIYEPDCNLAVWQRPLPAGAADYVQRLLQAGSRVSVRELVPAEAVAGELAGQLPDLPGREALAADVQQLAEMLPACSICPGWACAWPACKPPCARVSMWTGCPAGW